MAENHAKCMSGRQSTLMDHVCPPHLKFVYRYFKKIRATSNYGWPFSC